MELDFTFDEKIYNDGVYLERLKRIIRLWTRLHQKIQVWTG